MFQKLFLFYYNLALVLGIYDDKLQPGQAANVVEKMAEYLSTQNY